MASQVPMRGYTPRYELDPWQLFTIAWRLIFSEIRWNFIRLWHQWEINQLKKRLDQEKLRLAEVICSRRNVKNKYLDLKDPDLDLVLGQIFFLEEEIAHLRKELEVKRQIYVENRMIKYMGE